MRNAREMLESREFRGLVRRKWIVSVVLTACLFALYYGYILLIAMNKAFLARRIGEHTTLGIPLGAGVIVLSWVLTAVYVLWANGSHDVEAEKLKAQVGE